MHDQEQHRPVFLRRRHRVSVHDWLHSLQFGGTNCGQLRRANENERPAGVFRGLPARASAEIGSAHLCRRSESFVSTSGVFGRTTWSCSSLLQGSHMTHNAFSLHYLQIAQKRVCAEGDLCGCQRGNSNSKGTVGDIARATFQAAVYGDSTKEEQSQPHCFPTYVRRRLSEPKEIHDFTKHCRCQVRGTTNGGYLNASLSDRDVSH